MKNRVSVFAASGLIILAVIGIMGMFVTNPAGFIQRIAIVILIGLAIYFIVSRYNQSSPEKKEQRAFVRAAKKSKKRMNQKGGENTSQKSALGSLTSLKKGSKQKKKSPIHLTVIEGKKSKKKNRASF